MYRLLKPDGKLYICHTSSRRAINEIHRGVPDICTHLFPENAETRRWLETVGFKDVSIDDGQDDYLATARKWD
jgi:ubiquinone/menaquinone biosynthesis C-methylase UbiE